MRRLTRDDVHEMSKADVLGRNVIGMKHDRFRVPGILMSLVCGVLLGKFLLQFHEAVWFERLQDVSSLLVLGAVFLASFVLDDFAKKLDD